jgi:hypothetical protein
MAFPKQSKLDEFEALFDRPSQFGSVFFHIELPPGRSRTLNVCAQYLCHL